MIIKIIIIISLFFTAAFAQDSTPKSRIRLLLKIIDFSSDGQRFEQSTAARTELDLMNRKEVMDALQAIHQEEEVANAGARRAVQASLLRASVLRQLDSFGSGSIALDLARKDLTRIGQILLARKETDDLHVAPFEIESVVRIMAYYGAPEDIEDINRTTKSLAAHPTTLARIWSQSMQSDLKIFQKERERVMPFPAQVSIKEGLVDAPSNSSDKARSSEGRSQTAEGISSSSHMGILGVGLIVVSFLVLFVLFRRQNKK